MGHREQKTTTQRIVGKLARLFAGASVSAEHSPATGVAGSIDDDRGQLHDLGFHGDAYLLALVDRLLPFVDGFVETGANLGSTTRYVAERFSGLTVVSCEPGDEAAEQAAENVADYPNATVYGEFSPDFLHHVFSYAPQLTGALNCYFLDAHGHGFKWPLADEIAFITSQQSGVIIVDDCRVPDRPEFKYSKYAGQECCLDYIQAALDPRHDYDVVFPDYQDRTSKHHALSGYVLIAFGTPLLQQAISGDRKFKHFTLPNAENEREAA
jgi:predicted O-methyltransferase YrrM